MSLKTTNTNCGNVRKLRLDDRKILAIIASWRARKRGDAQSGEVVSRSRFSLYRLSHFCCIENE